MTRTNRLLLVLLVFSVAVAAFWFLALTPKREEAAALETQIAAKQTELDAARTQVAAYERARAAYPANYATVARLGKAVPADDDVRSLMVQIDAAAKRSGVEFEVIDVGKGTASAGAISSQTQDTTNVIPGATADASGFSTLPMSLAFRGSYFELSSFLTRLERFVTVTNRRIDVTGRLLLLQSISLVPDAAGFPQMRAQINATSYVVPAPGAVPSAATSPGSAVGSSRASGGPSSTATPGATSATVTGAVR
jgi:Tfp pilus assembly protein PilO